MEDKDWILGREEGQFVCPSARPASDPKTALKKDETIAGTQKAPSDDE
jgi:hypothetical protein